MWDSAAGWLERSHLHDHALGGSMAPENLVPFGRQCHDIMPTFARQERGRCLVNNGVHKSGWWQLFTDSAFGSDAGHLNPRSKVKLMRDSYNRFTQIERLASSLGPGGEDALEEAKKIIASMYGLPVVRRPIDVDGAPH
ncbi:hypothetical protein [Micromonospora sp. NPDC004551]|uniref:hypothetical protein n=1 Tax=Micromonospora sp. NPDC004551 TaxID=3154284 RepID=UPI0033ADD780